MAGKFAVDYVSLGNKIRQKRINTGLSQDMVSERVGLSPSFYGHIERGSKVPSVDSLFKIADYLNLSVDYLLMESRQTQDSDKKLQSDLANIFRDKNPAQTDYLLNILKVLSNNIDNLQS